MAWQETPRVAALITLSHLVEGAVEPDPRRAAGSAARSRHAQGKMDNF